MRGEVVGQWSLWSSQQGTGWGKGRLEGRRMMVGTMKQPLWHEGKVGIQGGGGKQYINQCHATSQNSKDLKNS